MRTVLINFHHFSDVGVCHKANQGGCLQIDKQSHVF